MFIKPSGSRSTDVAAAAAVKQLIRREANGVIRFTRCAVARKLRCHGVASLFHKRHGENSRFRAVLFFFFIGAWLLTGILEWRSLLFSLVIQRCFLVFFFLAVFFFRFSVVYLINFDSEKQSWLRCASRFA